MINTQAIKLTQTRRLIFVLSFIALSVATPMVAHFFGGVAAGRLFLPMHFFVLSAGLLLGWQAGLAVGILTPLISFSLTAMPLAIVLPFISIELASYGFFAGFLQERFKNVLLSLVGAMILGRAFLWLGIVILPTKLIANQYLIGAVQSGWRGIALQILLVPVIVLVIQKFLKNERI